MNGELWRRVDELVIGRLHTTDPSLSAVLARSRAAGLPPINVAPNQGRLLELLARAIGARRVLEIGTLGGFSTLYLARGVVPGGEVLSLELVPAHAEVARQNLADAGLASVVEILEGPALVSLQALLDRREAPFDLVFIDADKENLLAYFDAAVRLTRPGGLVLVDNVIRGGAVLDAASTDPEIRSTARLFEHVGADPRVTATALQTVGEKGHDGLLLALVRATTASDPA